MTYFKPNNWLAHRHTLSTACFLKSLNLKTGSKTYMIFLRSVKSLSHSSLKRICCSLRRASTIVHGSFSITLQCFWDLWMLPRKMQEARVSVPRRPSAIFFWHLRYYDSPVPVCSICEKSISYPSLRWAIVTEWAHACFSTWNSKMIMHFLWSLPWVLAKALPLLHTLESYAICSTHKILTICCIPRFRKTQQAFNNFRTDIDSFYRNLSTTPGDLFGAKFRLLMIDVYIELSKP